MRRFIGFLVFLTMLPSLALGGVYRFPGLIEISDGTVGAPGISFLNDPDSGLYRIGANNLGIGVNGTKIIDIGTAGVGVTGTLGVSGLATFNAGATIAASQVLTNNGRSTWVAGGSSAPLSIFASGSNKLFVNGGSAGGVLGDASGNGTLIWDATAITLSKPVTATATTRHFLQSSEGVTTRVVNIDNTNGSATASVIGFRTGSSPADKGFLGFTSSGDWVRYNAAGSSTPLFSQTDAGAATIGPDTNTPYSGPYHTTNGNIMSRTPASTTAGYGAWFLGANAYSTGINLPTRLQGLSGAMIQFGPQTSSDAAVFRVWVNDVSDTATGTPAQAIGVSAIGDVDLGWAGVSHTHRLQSNRTLNWASSTDTAGVVAGDTGAGSSFAVNTPSLNSGFFSGLTVDGSYSSLVSTVNLFARGVRSAGGYYSALNIGTTSGTTEVVNIDMDATGRVSHNYYTKLGELVDGGGTTPAFAVKVLTFGAISAAGNTDLAHGLNAARIKMVSGRCSFNSGTTFVKMDSFASNSCYISNWGSTNIRINNSAGVATTSGQVYVFYEAS